MFDHVVWQVICPTRPGPLPEAFGATEEYRPGLRCVGTMRAPDCIWLRASWALGVAILHWLRGHEQYRLAWYVLPRPRAHQYPWHLHGIMVARVVYLTGTAL